jgi:hypothetical protein
LVETIIHVGLHKTGTTYLQETVFPRLGVKFIDRPRVSSIGTWKLSETRTTLISNERFSGMPFKLNYPDTRFKLADKLYKYYPEAKIIIATRQLEPWLDSLWRQSFRAKSAGYRLSYDEWVKQINPSYWYMDSYVWYLKNKFPSVMQYAMEEFKADNQAIIKKICKFMSVKSPQYIKRIANKSLSNAIIAKRLGKSVEEVFGNEM